MTTSAAGRQAIPLREGNILHAYRDTRGIWTIGVGHTAAAGPPTPKNGMTITAAASDEILGRDLHDCETAVNEAIKVSISQNAFDACVSLAFNIGSPGFRGSSVVRLINTGNLQEAADAFLMWHKPPEILGRRKGERAQFLRPDIGLAHTAAETPVGSIAWVQVQLNKSGADPRLAVDGDLGPATLEAITAFQSARGLAVDGLAGPKTIDALNAL